MPDDRDDPRAEIITVRERVRALHARGMRVHEQFLRAVARQDHRTMSATAEEHAAINAEATGLIAAWRARVAARLGR